MTEMAVQKKLKLKSGAEIQIRLMSWPTWQRILEAASTHIGKDHLKTAFETVYNLWATAQKSGGIGSITAENLPAGIPAALPILVTAAIDAVNELSEIVVADAIREPVGQELEFAADFIEVKNEVIDFNPLPEMMEAEKNFSGRIWSIFTPMQLLSPENDADGSGDADGSDSNSGLPA